MVCAAGETPSKMLGQKMIYDPTSDRIILFGGSYYSSQYTFYGDTWSYDVAAKTWMKLAPTRSPTPRFNIAMTLDGDRGEIVLFGGFSASGRIADTWIYSIASNKWTLATPSTSPSRRSDAAIAYDSKNKKVVIFGGYGQNDNIMGDTWAFDTETRAWEQMSPATKPDMRYGGVMVYDTYTSKCLLFGGHLTASDGRDLGYENEVWAYDYTADNWEKITTTTKPPARYWHDLAYDPDDNRIILFSGSQGGGNNLGDTWIFNCREAKWTRVSSTSSPPARSQPSMAYDTETKSTIMFGGANLVSQGNFNYYDDVWALGADNQWKQLTASDQTAPTGQTSSGVPGFGLFEVSAGVCLGVALLLYMRRSSTRVYAP